MHLKLINTVEMERSAAEQREALFRKIRWHGMELLARREHSCRELISKLCQRYPDLTHVVESVVGQLAADGLQSNQRFVEAYISMRKRKGYGPHRIVNELKERGIDRDMISTELNAHQNSWFDQARKVRQKKFMSSDADIKLDLKFKAKQIRFLQYRGFSQDQIEFALDDL